MDIRYQSIQSASDLITPGCYLGKLDLKSAYRSVSVHPSQFQCTGLKWKFKGHSEYTYMYDNRLPFGAKLSVGIFHRLTQAVRRMLLKRGINVVVYLDDFLVVADTYTECQRGLDTLMTLVRLLGFSIAWEKTLGPTQCLTFLGIKIDTQAYTLSLPEDKVTSLHSLLTSFMTRSRASCRQLQQLAGKLSWAAHVVNGGRIYLQRVLDLIRPLRKAHHKVQLNNAFKQDISWWLTFLTVFNSRGIRSQRCEPSSVYTDACNQGAGIITDNNWSYINWKLDMPSVSRQHTHINVKETMAVILAIYRYAPTWRGQHVVVYTDNITTRAAINKGISKDPLVMMYLRTVFWLRNIVNFTITSVFIPGSINILADSVSRLHNKGHFLHWMSIVFGYVPLESTIWSYLRFHMSYPALCYLYLQQQHQRLCYKS